MKISKLLFIGSIILSLGTLAGCKKEKAVPKDDDLGISIVDYTINVYQDNDEGLLLDAEHKTDHYKIFYFGQNDNGVKLESIVYQNGAADSLFNFVLDEQERIQRMYITFPDGSFDSTLLVVEYPTSDTLIVSSYFYDWENQRDRLNYRYKAFNSGDGMDKDVIFQKSFKDDVIDKIAAKIFNENVKNVVSVLAITGVGIACPICVPTGVAVGVLLSFSSAMASDDINTIENPPLNTPTNPINHAEPSPSATPENPMSEYDCNYVWQGGASIDGCGICSGGTTGITPDDCDDENDPDDGSNPDDGGNPDDGANPDEGDNTGGTVDLEGVWTINFVTYDCVADELYSQIPNISTFTTDFSADTGDPNIIDAPLNNPPEDFSSASWVIEQEDNKSITIKIIGTHNWDCFPPDLNKHYAMGSLTTYMLYLDYDETTNEYYGTYSIDFKTIVAPFSLVGITEEELIPYCMDVESVEQQCLGMVKVYK